MRRPTVHDIAREAVVSLATVDRVLNARPGVRKRTVDKVQAAVERLGYVRDTEAANLARRRLYRFAFVLPEGPSQFVDTLRDALHEVLASQVAGRVAPTIVSVPFHDPHEIVRSLCSLDASLLDGIAILAPETPQVRDAISRLKEAGLAVVALVSDLPNSRRDHFVGINSVGAGRTAALLLGKFVSKQGEILVITNSMRSRDSLERRLGFDDVLSADFPHLSALPSVEFHDDRRRMEEVAGRVAHSRPDLAGVYSMGSGNRLLLDALRPTGRLGDIVVVAHELTPTTRRALLDGELAAVIRQDVGHLARSTIRVLKSLCDNTPVFEAQERVRIEIVVRENLP